MNEQIKKILDPLRTFWGKLTKRTRIVVLACLGAAVLLAVIAGTAMNRTQYTVLYSGIKNDEEQQITSELHTMGVDYKSDNGTIYVDKAKEDSARMQLANEGYPKSAPNYDFFTKNVGVMTTDEERKIIQQYSLEERLGAIIKTMDSVNTAYVTISLPQNTSYAWQDNKSTASASVAIGLVNGKTLGSNQVNGIKQLVAKSVPNLSPDNVTVLDTSTGDELAASSSSGSEGSTQISLSEFKLTIEKQYEDNLQKKILNLLAQAYGRGNISVSVKSKMDLDKKIQDIVTYTPSVSGGKGIVSHSEETTETQTNSPGAGGVPGTQSNTDTTTTYPGVTVSGGVITTRDSKTFDYLVNKVEEQIQSNAAALDDLTVAVVINSDTINNAKKQEVTSLIANAAAVDPSKVALMTAPMSSASPSSAQTTMADISSLLANSTVLLIVGGVLLLLIVLLAVLITAKKRRARREQLLANLQPTVPQISEGEELGEESEDESADSDEEGTEDGEEGVNEEMPTEGVFPEAKEGETMPTESIEQLRNASGGKEQRVKSDLKDFSDRNPEIVAQLVRSWLKGDDNKNG